MYNVVVVIVVIIIIIIISSGSSIPDYLEDCLQCSLPLPCTFQYHYILGIFYGIGV